ncbi:MAG TPA: LysR family transcriptional regulator [Polyangiaceae bacterium]
MDLNDLLLFKTIADAAGVSAAAKQLGVPKSSVSRGLARLEREAGVTLMHRTTRRVSLSTAGLALYGKVAPLIAELERSVVALPERASTPSGRLRITAAPDFAAVVLADILAGFTQRYPQVELDVHVSSQFVDLVAEQIDVALRISAQRLKDSALIARPLASFSMRVYGSPEYLSRVVPPKAPEDLTRLRWVGLPGRRKHALTSGASTAVIQVRPALACDDMFFARAVLRAGAGVGLLPGFLAERDLRRGDLVCVLPRWELPTGRLWLVRPRSGEVPAKVQAFERYLSAALETRSL